MSRIAFLSITAHLTLMKLDQDIVDAVHVAMGLGGDPADHRVVVAMSGGVDSSVVAALLKVVGYDVVGITLQLYDHGEAIRRKGACCAGQDIHDARRVAASLDIPHYILDFESRFKDAVINEFVAGYLAGETPIPCVKCNQTVKFSDLLQHARDLDAKALVTGHYIESRARGDGSTHRDLFTPSDMARDQSYFLFATTQEQIDFLRFPLGPLPKAETRRIASELGLVVADKPDSQDICFVPEGNYADVILRLRPDAAEPGDIVHLDGRVLGRHEGILHFTIGQRRGLGIADAEPLYVIRVDAALKRVVVGPREALKQNDIRIGRCLPKSDRLGRRLRRPCVAARKVQWCPSRRVNMASRRGRRVCFMMARGRVPACWVAASSFRTRRHRRWVLESTLQTVLSQSVFSQALRHRGRGSERQETRPAHGWSSRP
jgi:tRNA-specific 2-thiouridylase